MVNPENDHAYKRIVCDTWEDAKAKAETEGAYLVAINDASEQKWLEALYPEKAFFWIGCVFPKKGHHGSGIAMNRLLTPIGEPRADLSAYPPLPGIKGGSEKYPLP